MRENRCIKDQNLEMNVLLYAQEMSVREITRSVNTAISIIYYILRKHNLHPLR